MLDEHSYSQTPNSMVCLLETLWKSLEVYLLKYILRVYTVNKILQRGAEFTIHKICSEKFRGKRRLSMECFWPGTLTLLKICGNLAVPFQPYNCSCV